MICQNCRYPHASPTLNCQSCGWAPTKDYHPELGAGPLNQAKWILGQPIEVLERLYGENDAKKRIDSAQHFMNQQPVPDAPKPVPAQIKAAEVTAVVQPVESPFVKERRVRKPKEPKPVDERIMPNEAPAPTGG